MEGEFQTDGEYPSDEEYWTDGMDERTVSIKLATSVVDLNTLNLDPDPGFWPNLDPDLGQYYQFWKKKFKIVL